MKNRSAAASIIFSLALACFIFGCGLKANPVPRMPLPATDDNPAGFRAVVADKSIILVWKPGKTDETLRFVEIERSALGKTETVCRECPRTYERIGEWSIAPAFGRTQEYKYADSDVEKGHLYSYRLSLCRDEGICRMSQVLDVEMK